MALKSARAALAAGDRALALRWFEQAVALDPRHRPARLDLASMLRNDGRLDEAEALYRALLAEAPGLAAAHLGLGHCARRRGDLAAAAEHFATAVEGAPHDQRARFDLAAAYRDLGRLDAAATVYRALLAEHPGLLAAHTGLATCARRKGDLRAAARHLAAAVESAPGDRRTRQDLATVLRDLGRLDEAEAVYRGLLADEPGLLAAHVGLGHCARRRGDRAAALEHFAAAAASDPTNASACLEVALEHRDQGQFDAAREVVRSLLSRLPDTAEAAQAEAWASLGQIERRAGAHEAALAAFQQAYDKAPTKHLFAVEIAAEEQALGHGEAATRWLRLAAERDQINGLALVRLGEQQRQAGELEKALELFQQASLRQPTLTVALVQTAQTLADLGHLEQAFKLLTEAPHGQDDRPEVIGKHTGLLRAAGRPAEALVLIRKACRKNPRSFTLWLQRVELERAAGKRQALQACLRAAPASTSQQHAQVHYLAGQAAEADWDFAEANSHYRQAIALAPGTASYHERLGQTAMKDLDLATGREQRRIAARLNFKSRHARGLTTNMSQGLPGQLMNEYLIDGEALADLQALRALAPRERIEPLLELVRRRPDHTPTAVTLMIALRQAGRLHGKQAGTPGTRIPASIVQYWDRALPPSDVKLLMRSWQQQNPGHDYRSFNDAAAVAYLKQQHAPQVLEAYRHANKPAMKADIFRLAYLYSEGGIYADADDRCLQPVESFLPAGRDFVARQEEFGSIGNNFLAVVPTHPVIGLALHLGVAAVNRGDRDILWLSTGPGLLTRAFAQILAGGSGSLRQRLESVALLDRHELAPNVAIHCTSGYKKTHLHWNSAAPKAPRKVLSFGKRPQQAGDAAALPPEPHARLTQRPDASSSQ